METRISLPYLKPPVASKLYENRRPKNPTANSTIPIKSRRRKQPSAVVTGLGGGRCIAASVTSSICQTETVARLMTREGRRVSGPIVRRPGARAERRDRDSDRGRKGGWGGGGVGGRGGGGGGNAMNRASRDQNQYCGLNAACEASLYVCVCVCVPVRLCRTPGISHFPVVGLAAHGNCVSLRT